MITLIDAANDLPILRHKKGKCSESVMLRLLRHAIWKMKPPEPLISRLIRCGLQNHMQLIEISPVSMIDRNGRVNAHAY